MGRIYAKRSMTIMGLAVAICGVGADATRALPSPPAVGPQEPESPAPARREAEGPLESNPALRRGEEGRRAEAETADRGAPTTPLLPPAPSFLGPNAHPIDLNTALRLAGVQNPELNFARQRVVEAAALRQLAAAQFLPTLNAGTNYDAHTGVLQQSNGNILTVNRSAVYVGAGANAVAAGTVNIPGVFLGGNVAQGVFGYLISKQLVREREFTAWETRNQVFLKVALAYSELTRSMARRAVAMQAREEVREVARLTASYANSGQGRRADANRAATELARRESAFLRAEGDVLANSARLCQQLNLDPSIRLYPTDAVVVPMPIVPDPMPIQELIALALLRRPELGERRTVIRESMLALEGAKVLPFSPTVLIGFSGGGFGGGSNLVRPIFGGFGGRSDFDAVGYWTIRNLGVGNIALINLAGARLQASRYQELAVLNKVRAEVAESYALSHARFAQVGTYEEAVRSGANAFKEDYIRITQRVERDVLPIELLNSFDLLADARNAYLDAIVDYNNAQFGLYVAMGQPPAASLSRPVPVGGIVVPGQIFPPGSSPRRSPDAPPPTAPEAPAPAAPPAPGAGGANPFAAPPEARVQPGPRDRSVVTAGSLRTSPTPSSR